MLKIASGLDKLSKLVFKVFFVLASIDFAALLILLFVNVVARNILNHTYDWINEFTMFMFTWLMWFGISIGVYYEKHLGVEFLVSKYPEKIRRGLSYFATVVTIVMFVVLIVYGFVYVKKTIKMLSPVMGIPYGYVYLCVPTSSILSLFFCIARIIDKLAGLDKKEAN